MHPLSCDAVYDRKQPIELRPWRIQDQPGESKTRTPRGVTQDTVRFANCDTRNLPPSHAQGIAVRISAMGYQ